MNGPDVQVNILVNGNPVTEVVHNGETYIEGRQGTKYSLKIKNLTNEKIMVIPSVDGLSVIDSLPAGVNSPGYLVEARQSIVIPGWKVNGSEAASFVFNPRGGKGDYSTYVESIGENPTNLGVIGFLFFKEKKKYVQTLVFPKWNISSANVNDEVKFRSQSTASDPYPNVSLRSSGVIGQNTARSYSGQIAASGAELGTGFGEATKFNTTKVEFEREDQPHGVMVFHYDTLQGLKRRGVPTEAFTRKAEKYANPFPASPDLLGEGCRIPSNWNRNRRKK